MLNNIAALMGGATPPVLGDYESIATATVGAGGVGFFEFTSIPSTYSHLQLRLMTKTTYSATPTALLMQLNSDATSTYAHHGLFGDGASAGAFAVTTSTSAGAGYSAGATATSTFGVQIIDILDYKNTNKNKTIRGLTGADFNGSGQLRFISGLWQSTSAVTTIKIYDANGGNLSQYSHGALYGVK
jgi:hypothetical protein